MYLLIDLMSGVSYSQDSNFVQYRDPKGEFNIEYPSDWILYNSSSATAPDVFWALSDIEKSPFKGTLAIWIEDIPEDATVDIGNVTLENYANKTLEYYNFSLTPENIREVKQANFTEYEIDKNDAVAVGVTYDLNTESRKKIDIASFVESKFIRIEFVSTPESFQALLPIVEKMVNSLFVY